MRLSLSLLIAAALLVVTAPAAGAKTVWLCKPGAKSNPCESSLTATKVSSAGQALGTERIRLAGSRAPVDCFYVYPTVSEQPMVNANRQVDAQLRAIAAYQASRFSAVCRVWAPVYRQLTLSAIADPSKVTPAALGIAYRDVRAAWRDYLRRHNHGRGVVFIGHSQGTFVLRELIRKAIDPRPVLRRRMISAILLGGNVTVAKGKDSGGDFKNIRACRRSNQIGCVVAYSTFNEPPPPTALFGRVPAADADKLEVLCNNPADLRDGGRGRLDGYVRTDPFPGLLGAGIKQQIGELPSVPTPWIKFAGQYSARCVRENDAHVLKITEVDGARHLVPSPDANWGLHLADVNLALGDLVSLVLRQSAASIRPR
jgi:pimeloyl-ACP methyl ester carboxylesterase